MLAVSNFDYLGSRTAKIGGYLLLLGLVFLVGCVGEKSGENDRKNAQDTEAVSLEDRLADLRRELSAQAPPEMRDIGKRQIESLEVSGLLDEALNVGDSIPDFRLPNAIGETVASSDLLESGPMVLTFYRGVW